jgi:uncharacterized membrane protein
MVTTSLVLMAHHAFGCWHGDYRLRRRWGEVGCVVSYAPVPGRKSVCVLHTWGHGISWNGTTVNRSVVDQPASSPPMPKHFTKFLQILQDFEEVKGRTSIVPFQAIWEGRQKLPADYWREFVRLPYFVIAAFTLGTYWAHPLMQRASYWLKW